MKRILVVQVRTGEYEKHERHCFESVFSEHSDRFEYINGLVEFEKLPQKLEELNQYSCVIIGGSGEADISQIDKQPQFKLAIKPLSHLVSLMVKNDFPLFSICLGHQLLCYTLGSDVKKEHGEIGSVTLSLTDEGQYNILLRSLPKEIVVQHAHKDSVLSLPKEATLLATNSTCPIQLIKVKENIYGAQFHAEMTEKEYVERHELYAQLNPESGYSDKLPQIKREVITSSDGPQILENFLNRYVSKA